MLVAPIAFTVILIIPLAQTTPTLSSGTRLTLDAIDYRCWRLRGRVLRLLATAR